MKQFYPDATIEQKVVGQFSKIFEDIKKITRKNPAIDFENIVLTGGTDYALNCILLKKRI